MASKSRPPVPISTQVAVYFNGAWLCSLCRRPTIFAPALKHAARFVELRLPGLAPAYFNQQWRRDLAPLLDELAACIDHIEAFSRGGSHDPSNFAVACARCNQRKGMRSKDAYLAENPPWRVDGKYGEPLHWDGLTSLFVAFARDDPGHLSTTEKTWLKAIEKHLTNRAI